MKNYVQIQSSMNVTVTCGLDNTDFTKTDSDIPDRLKISADWPRCSVLIKQGQHWYPSEIAEWATVKALARDGILTIGQESDTADSEVDKAELQEKLSEIKGKGKKSLTEVAGNA